MWPGAADVDELRVRHELEELLRAFLAQEVADPAAHEQRRQLDAERGLLQADGIDERGAGLVGAAELAADERGIPVPVPAAVLAVAQVLGEPAEVGRARAVRVVRLDRVGDVVERREAVVHVLGHEGADAHAALLLHPRRDVDEHERAGDVLVGALADRGERRDAAERRADERGRSVERLATTARMSPENASSV